MLAEVASKTLRNQSTTPSDLQPPRKNSTYTKQASGRRKRKFTKKKARKSSSPANLMQKRESLSQIAPSRLLQLFSRCICNELWKTFSYTCTFDPEMCGQTFNGFGGDDIARKKMVSHIQQHIQCQKEERQREMMKVGNSTEAKQDVEKTLNIQITQHHSPSIVNQTETATDSIWSEHCYFNIWEPQQVKQPEPQTSTLQLLLQSPTGSAVVTAPQLDNSWETIEHDGPDSEMHDDFVAEVVVEEQKLTKRKPKGKAKFIGQSDMEKFLALDLIEQMKHKQLSPLDSLECRICLPSRTFTAPTTLLSHYRSHAGIKPYECRICQSSFTRQHSLKYHMLIHSNETRFTCLECGRKFRHPSHFREHQRRHTGESPFECSLCHSRFKTRNTFKRHLKTRHDQEMSAAENTPKFATKSTMKKNTYLPATKQGQSSQRITSPAGKMLLPPRQLEKVAIPGTIQKKLPTIPRKEISTKEDIIQQAIRSSDIQSEVTSTATALTLSHIAEIAQAILSHPAPEHPKGDTMENNNLDDFSTRYERIPCVDTLVSFQYAAPAASEGGVELSENKLDPATTDSELYKVIATVPLNITLQNV